MTRRQRRRDRVFKHRALREIRGAVTVAFRVDGVPVPRVALYVRTRHARPKRRRVTTQQIFDLYHRIHSPSPVGP